MLKAAGKEEVELVRQLAGAIFDSDEIPTNWEESIVLNLYKGKGEALDFSNFRDLKLTDQVMKLLKRVLDFYIHKMVSTDEKPFSFVPGKGTTGRIFSMC